MLSYVLQQKDEYDMDWTDYQEEVTFEAIWRVWLEHTDGSLPSHFHWRILSRNTLILAVYDPEFHDE